MMKFLPMFMVLWFVPMVKNGLSQNFQTVHLKIKNVPHETGVCYNTVFFLWPRNQFHLLYHSIDNMSVAFTRFLTNQNAQKCSEKMRSKGLGNNAWIHKSRLTPISTSKNDWFGQKLSKTVYFNNLVPKSLNSSNYFNFWSILFVCQSRTFPVNVVNLPYF